MKVQIEVITYEEERLDYFTALMNRAHKKYKRLFKRFKDAPMLSEEAESLSNAGRESLFCQDVVEMLENRKQSEGEWTRSDEYTEQHGYLYKCSCCGVLDWYGKYCSSCGAKMKGEDNEQRKAD